MGNKTTNPKPMDHNNEMEPMLTHHQANEMLNNVFRACDMEPSTIPVEVLESWGNYKRPRFRVKQNIIYIFLVILICLPFAFFKPNILATRTNVENSASAVYNIKVKSLIPVRSIQADLDGYYLNVKQIGSREFKVELAKNGVLTITVELYNGQIDSRQYQVSYIDGEKPEFVEFVTEGDKVTITVRDTFSGVDYENITGLEPDSWNEETGEIIFTVPAEPVSVTIPDHAGNELVLLLSPILE